MTKMWIDGVTREMTQEEELNFQTENQKWLDGAFDRAMANLREERKMLLTNTDYLALSDNTMSSAMTTYRQALRDITSGLDTVAKVNAKQFPTKPGA